MLTWTIFAAIIWLFILLFLRSDVKRLWTVAFWTILVGYLLSIDFLEKELYLFGKSYYLVEGIPLGYLIGLAGVGIIMIRFLPEEKIWQLPYLIFFSILFTGIEYLALEQGYLLYLNWSLYNSFLYKLLAFISIAWLSGLTVTRRSRNYFFR